MTRATKNGKTHRLFAFLALFFCVHAAFAQNATVADTIAPMPAKKYKPKISGFIQVQALQHFDTNGDGDILPNRFRVQRARLRVEGKIQKNIGYQLEIDPRAPEIVGVMRDAYIAFYHIPKHALKVGQQKTQFGYEGRMSSSELFFVNRTDVSDNLARGINLRDIGIGLSGHIHLSEKFRFEDAITVVNGAGMNVQYDDTPRKNIWGRMGLRYKQNELLWRLGVSGANGDFIEPADTAAQTPAFTLDFTRIGGDIQVEHKWFTFATEYIQSFEKDLDGPAEIPGYYALLTGKTKWDIGPSVRYEDLDGEFTRWTMGAYYGKPKSKFRILANYEIRNVQDDPDFPNGEDNRFYIWMQLKF